MNDPDRAEFERRMIEKHGTVELKRNPKHPNLYLDPLISHQWQGFKMALEWERSRSTPQIPEGWQLVPKEPTEEMLNALTDGANQHDSWAEGYKAMLAAAPNPVIRDFRNTEGDHHE